MKFRGFIKESLIAAALLFSGVAMAVTLPATPYSETSGYSGYGIDGYDSPYGGAGPVYPSKAFLALAAGVDDCAPSDTDPNACAQCCANAYGNCTKECEDDPSSDECKTCQAKISACKREKCEKSLPLDGGEWVLIMMTVVAVIGKMRNATKWNFSIKNA